MPKPVTIHRKMIRWALVLLLLPAWLLVAWGFWKKEPPQPRQTIAIDATHRPLCLSADGQTLAMCRAGREQFKSQVITLWDTHTGQQRGELEGHTGFIWRAAFTPDGKRLASASDDGTTRLWDLTRNRELCSFDQGKRTLWKLAFSADGRTLAFQPNPTARLKELLFLDGKTLEEHPMPEVKINWGSVRSEVQWTAGGEARLMVTTPLGADVQDALTGRLVCTLRPQSVADYPAGVNEISPEGRWVATTRPDGAINVWDLTNGEKHASYCVGKTVRRLLFSPMAVGSPPRSINRMPYLNRCFGGAGPPAPG